MSLIQSNLFEYWRTSNNKKTVEKSVWNCAPMICLLSQVMTSYQESTTKQPIERWILTTDRAKTHRHTDKRINEFLKHKLIKHFLSNLNNNANETSASWYDVTHYDDFRRIVILKRSLNFFLAFCGVIYQNLLHRRGLYCSKQLETTFSSILWKIVAYHL